MAVRQDIFEDSLSERQKGTLKLFGDLPKDSCYLNGYMVNKTTKMDYNIKLMLGYNKSKNPIYSTIYRVPNKELFLSLIEVLDEVQILAQDSLSNSNKDTLEALFSGV